MHVLAIACVVSLFGLFQGIEQQRNPALEIHDKVVYYSASDFLPAIDTGSEDTETRDDQTSAESRSAACQAEDYFVASESRQHRADDHRRA